MPVRAICMSATVGLVGLLTAAVSPGFFTAQITDFNAWSPVEDPANPFFAGSIDSASQITLSASDATGSSPGNIPAGTDIGFQSVNGETVAGSTAGFAFDATQSFSIAVDYQAVFANSPSGGLSFGFGIGEDRSGANSAGVVFVTQAGLPAAIPFAGPAGGAATVNNSPIAALLSPTLSADPANLVGSLHVGYNLGLGGILVGVANPGDNGPAAEISFDAAAVTDNWTGADLLASLFIRSDNVNVPIFGTQSTVWTDGNASVSFSNFRVTNGQAYRLNPQPIPEPTSLALLGLGGLLMAKHRRWRQQAV